MSNLKFKNKLRIASLTLVLFLFAFQISPTLAQNPQGLTVSPSILDINLDQDEPEIELFYKNNSTTTISLNFTAVDFTELEEGAKVKFLENQEAGNYKYSLSSWITFEREQVTLVPQEELTLKVSIAKNELSPGAHYTSIQAAISTEKPDTGNINLTGVLSSLLFVTTSTGNEIEDAEIVEIRPNRSFLNLPNKFVFRFNNRGNVALVPNGLLQVYDPFGRGIARGILNEGSLKTLPETIRRYEISTKTLNTLLLPGLYNAKITTKFGNNNQEITKNVAFVSQGNINPLFFTLIISTLTLSLLILKRRKKSKD